MEQDILDLPEKPVETNPMKIETAGAVLFVVGMLFKFQHWPAAGIMLSISLSSLAFLYCPLGFYFFSSGKMKEQNLALSVIAGFFLSIVCMGILFKIQHWQGWYIYMQTSIIAAPALLAVIAYLRQKAKPELHSYYNRMLIRASVLAVLTVLFYL